MLLVMFLLGMIFGITAVMLLLIVRINKEED